MEPEYKLSYGDLPQDETLLSGTLGELGFQSFIARSMPRKEIEQSTKVSAKEDLRSPVDLNNPEVMTFACHDSACDFPKTHATKSNAYRSPGVTAITIHTNDAIRLSEAILKGLVVARRAAFEMVTIVAQSAGMWDHGSLSQEIHRQSRKP